MPHTGWAGPWGSGSWGGASWGGGSGGTITLLSALAHRENVFRLEFSFPVYFSTILDPDDAADPDKYSVSAVAGSVGLDGNPARPLSVIEILLPDEQDGVSRADFGRFVDVVVDRPMTPNPALYDVAATDIHSADLAAVTSGTFRVPAVYRKIASPQIEVPLPSRDIANPQTLSAARASTPNPTDPILLGTIRYADDGDYASDEGNASLRKRVIRRGITRRRGFAHLPRYGVGLLDYGKRLAVGATLAAVAAEYEAQLLLEPDVARARVVTVVDPTSPGLVRFQVFVRPKYGRPERIEIPVITG